MTPAKSDPTNVVVVDGSNIATEGRSMPSLAQLQEAVMAFTEEFPDAVVTVVVDATFGHRIDKKELAEFDAAVAHNELVAPPAGAIGRGDAFVLSIANKVGARILSNDSFQEFHGDYPWLFDEGRLIGGKPVPFVGWVFVERLPVKGAISRKATRNGRTGGRGDREPRAARRTVSKAASLPMPVPKAPPPRPSRQSADEPAAIAEPVADTNGTARVAAAPSGGPVNDLLPFLDFVEHHPVGSSVNGVVESYSSHGAYVAIGDLRGYVPLRLMGDPPPRSAREMMKLGDAVTLVVTSFAPSRRSVDLSIPKVAPVSEVASSPVLDDLAEAVSAQPTKSRRRTTTKSVAPATDTSAVDDEQVSEEAAEPEPEPEAKAPSRRRASKRVAATEPETPVEPAVTEAAEPAPEALAEAPATTQKRKPTAKKAAATKKKAAAKKLPTEEVPAEKAPADAVATEAPAKKRAAPKKRAAAKKQAAAPKVSAANVPAAVESATAETPVKKKRAAAKAPAAKAPTKAPVKRTARKAAAAAGTSDG